MLFKRKNDKRLRYMSYKSEKKFKKPLHHHIGQTSFSIMKTQPHPPF